VFIAEKILNQKNGYHLTDIEAKVTKKPHLITYIPPPAAIKVSLQA